MTAPAIACACRHWLWRLVCALSGGLTVTGSLPTRTRGCVVVANHSSHADTAALLAALPPTARPVFAAAADYWFDVPVRRLLVTSLAGALPVHRTTSGTYTGLLAAAQPALAAGRAVVIYPEGTRGSDGTVGEFRSGALRLARDCAVPVVPVALSGTGRVLPKHGRLHRAPMRVRIGEPIDPLTVSPAQLRDRVVALQQCDTRAGGAPEFACSKVFSVGSAGKSPAMQLFAPPRHKIHAEVTRRCVCDVWRLGRGGLGTHMPSGPGV